jgi:hypothetical protein
MSDFVFICYSRKDEDFTLKLAANLKREGVPVWLDQWDIPSGANWNRTIEKALKECTHLLVILSRSSAESDEVQSEWLSALDEGKLVVPVLYQPCQIPFRLKSIQYIDFTSRSPDDKESLGQILKSLGAIESADIKPIAKTEHASESLLNNLMRIYKTKSKERQIILASIAFIFLTSIYFLIYPPINPIINGSASLGKIGPVDSNIDIDVNMEVFEEESNAIARFELNGDLERAKHEKYKITVYNKGNETLQDVVLSAYLAKGIKFENTRYYEAGRGKTDVTIDPPVFDEDTETKVVWNLGQLVQEEIKSIIMTAYIKPYVDITKVSVEAKGKAPDGFEVRDSQNSARIVICEQRDMGNPTEPCDPLAGLIDCVTVCPDWTGEEGANLPEDVGGGI